MPDVHAFADPAAFDEHDLARLDALCDELRLRAFDLDALVHDATGSEDPQMTQLSRVEQLRLMLTCWDAGRVEHELRRHA